MTDKPKLSTSCRQVLSDIDLQQTRFCIDWHEAYARRMRVLTYFTMIYMFMQGNYLFMVVVCVVNCSSVLTKTDQKKCNNDQKQCNNDQKQAIKSLNSLSNSVKIAINKQFKYFDNFATLL